MSILIKMEMPQSCMVCRFSQIIPMIQGKPLVMCSAKMLTMPMDGLYSQRYSGCPLIEAEKGETNETGSN